MDWRQLIDYLRTDRVLGFFADHDPMEVFTNPIVLVSSVVVFGLLVFFKFYRTVALLVSGGIVWFGLMRCMPTGDAALSLYDLVIFAGCGVVAAVILVYFFLIRGD